MAGIRLHPGSPERNSGAISGSNYGVEIYGGAGKVANKGTISGRYEGVGVFDDGAVTNSGASP